MSMTEFSQSHSNDATSAILRLKMTSSQPRYRGTGRDVISILERTTDSRSVWRHGHFWNCITLMDQV